MSNVNANWSLDAFVTELYTCLLLGKRALWTTMHHLIHSLPAHDQKGVFDVMVRDLTRKYLQGGAVVGEKEYFSRNAGTVGGVAAMISGLVQNNKILEAHLIHWLTSGNGEYAGLGLDIRRAVIVTLASNQGMYHLRPMWRLY